MYAFRNKASVWDEELLAHRPTPKLEGHLLSAARDCLFNILAATLHIGGAVPCWLGPTIHGKRILNDWHKENKKQFHKAASFLENNKLTSRQLNSFDVIHSVGLSHVYIYIYIYIYNDARCRKFKNKIVRYYIRYPAICFGLHWSHNHTAQTH